MFCLINWTKGSLWVFSDSARTKLVVKFGLPKEGWKRVDMIVQFGNVFFDIRPNSSKGYFNFEMGNLQLAELTQNFPIQSMSLEYQQKSPRGWPAFAKLVTKLLGHGRIVVTKIKEGKKPAMYNCMVYSTNGTSSIQDFENSSPTGFGGTPTPKDLKLKDHSPTKIGEYTLDWEHYRKSGLTFRNKVQTKNPNQWVLTI